MGHGSGIGLARHLAARALDLMPRIAALCRLVDSRRGIDRFSIRPHRLVPDGIRLLDLDNALAPAAGHPQDTLLYVRADLSQVNLHPLMQCTDMGFLVKPSGYSGLVGNHKHKISSSVGNFHRFARALIHFS
jgi:hypothetical protein